MAALEEQAVQVALVEVQVDQAPEDLVGQELEVLVAQVAVPELALVVPIQVMVGLAVPMVELVRVEMYRVPVDQVAPKVVPEVV